MSLGAWAIQAAIYDRLASDLTLTSLGARVYDDVPQGTEFPYVVVGDETITDDGGKDFQGFDRLMSIDVFSRYSGNKEAKQIMDQVFNLLHDQPLTVSTQQLIVMRLAFAPPVLRDPDGVSRHGVMRFRIKTFSDATYTAAVWLTDDAQEWVP